MEHKKETLDDIPYTLVAQRFFLTLYDLDERISSVWPQNFDFKIRRD